MKQAFQSYLCFSKGIKKFVCYVGDYVVRQVSLDTDDMLEVVLPFENVLDVVAMDWDPINDEMYWAESYNDEITIRKGKMRPPFCEVFLLLSIYLQLGLFENLNDISYISRDR